MKFSSTVSRSRRKSRKVCLDFNALSDAPRPRRYAGIPFCVPPGEGKAFRLCTRRLTSLHHPVSGGSL